MAGVVDSVVNVVVPCWYEIEPGRSSTVRSGATMRTKPSMRKLKVRKEVSSAGHVPRRTRNGETVISTTLRSAVPNPEPVMLGMVPGLTTMRGPRFSSSRIPEKAQEIDATMRSPRTSLRGADPLSTPSDYAGKRGRILRREPVKSRHLIGGCARGWTRSRSYPVRADSSARRPLAVRWRIST